MTETAAFWDKHAAKYAASPIKDMDSYERGMARTASYLKPSDRVLEVGCGTGSSAIKLAPHIGSILATDVSPKMIEIARSKDAGDHNIEFEVAQTDAPMSGQFDVVLGFNIFHLVQNVPGTLTQLHSMLKPGGLFISKTPCLGNGNILFPILIPVMQLIGKAPYVGMFSVKKWDQMIKETGFELVETGIFPKRPPSRFVMARKL
jgi:ubiquinone/menaquinone biosynthesis C-methylase UbiE